jgi:hypothetical protein
LEHGINRFGDTIKYSRYFLHNSPNNDW